MTVVIAVMTFAIATTGAMELNKNPMEAEARQIMYIANTKKKKWSAPSRKPVEINTYFSHKKEFIEHQTRVFFQILATYCVSPSSVADPGFLGGVNYYDGRQPIMLAIFSGKLPKIKRNFTERGANI